MIEVLSKDAFLNLVAKNAAPTLLKSAGKQVEKGKNTFRVGFNSYYDRIYERISTVKIIVSGDQPLKLKDVYTNIDLSPETGKSLSDHELIRQLSNNSEKIIVSGTAGSGKTMMMRYAVLQTVRTSNRVLPVFFELRVLNSEANFESFENSLWEYVSQTSNFSRERLKDAAKKGAFVFILDGLDEINLDIRAKVETSLRLFTEKYHHCAFILSSRPDESLSSWSKFSVFSVDPVSRKKVIGLLKKVPFNDAVKTEFLDAIDIEFYQKHRSFLSVPLLASMMLLTYSHFANTPEKLHIFYAQVFEALFYRHDLKKEGRLDRDVHSGLEIDEFSKVMQYFACSTYLANKISFERNELIKFLDDSIVVTKPYSEKPVRPKLVMEDLLKTVCLMINEGLEIRFTHRSFQEYFTALFLANTRSVNVADAISAVSQRSNSDNVLSLLYGINSDLVEQEYILPKLNNVLGVLDVDKSELPFKLYSVFLPGAKCCPSSEYDLFDKIPGDYGVGRNTEFVRYDSNEYILMMILLGQFYPAHFKHLYDGPRAARLRDSLFLVPEKLLHFSILKGLKRGPYSIEELETRIRKSKKIEKFSLELVEVFKLIRDDVKERQEIKSDSLNKLILRRKK